MPRRSPVFECTACGHRSPKWVGRCPACGGWNTIEQLPDEIRRATAPAGTTSVEAGSIAAADDGDDERWSTGMAAFDRVLGGGMVPGAAILLAGEPGVGKSTLLLQLAARQASSGQVLYVTAEESPRQVRMRARRLGAVHDDILLLPEPSVEGALAEAQRIRPRILIADSVQTMYSERVPAVPGTVTQVREVAGRLVELVKSRDTVLMLVGHVTKEGIVAGPRSLEHLVDVVLDFAGSTSHAHRTLRATKNRFGPAMELALLSMTERGLDEIVNPSAALLSDRVRNAPGSAVGVVLEGTTPLLVEVQALVSRSTLANPRRVAQGVESGRLALLLAVLEKRAGLRLADRDVFVNVVGGLDVAEPALDTALAAAILSSAAERPLAGDVAFFGEVGLLGEVRAVNRPEERIREALALGFSSCAVPASTTATPGNGARLLPLKDVAGLVELLQSD